MANNEDSNKKRIPTQEEIEALKKKVRDSETKVIAKRGYIVQIPKKPSKEK